MVDRITFEGLAETPSGQTIATHKLALARAERRSFELQHLTFTPGKGWASVNQFYDLGCS